MKRPREAPSDLKEACLDLRHDPADNCETPLEAFVHIAPVLQKIAQRNKIAKTNLKLWDPYFCQGAAEMRLRSLGFHGAVNQDVDFYGLLKVNNETFETSSPGEGARLGGVITDGNKRNNTSKKIENPNASSIPPHDILITNPPFSGDHCKCLVEYMLKQSEAKAFAILAPEYVHRKTWFAPLAKRFPQMFFVVPKRRYAFVAASGGRLANAKNTKCRHFLRDGTCPKGDVCLFVHGDESGEQGEQGVQNGDGVNNGDDVETKQVLNNKIQKTKSDETSHREIVAPFDVVWHVYCGSGHTDSVVAAWRQKFSGGKKHGPGTGASLVTGTDELKRALSKD